MTKEMPSVDELRVLADAVCDGALTEHDALRLEQMLHGNAEAQRLYLACVRLDGYLLWEFGQQTQEAAPPRPAFPTFFGNTIHATVGYFSSDWPVAYLVATVIFGIGLVVGSLVPVSQPMQVAKQSAPLPSHLSYLPSLVGRITGMLDCRFDRHSEISDPKPQDPRPKTLVHLGDKFALASGLMEITYDTGAKVSLQGPVTYEVESRDGGFLSVGKLTARLDTKGEGGTRNAEKASNPKSSFPRSPSPFVVRTPTATVTDLGTEFGIEVGTDRACEVHVLQGIVRAEFFHSSGQSFETVQLNANEGRRYECDLGRVTAIPVNRVKFQQMHVIDGESRRRQWLAHSQQLRQDPTLIAYYAFEPVDGNPRVLPNLTAAGRASDGRIEDGAWTVGRWPGKRALRFNGYQACVKVDLPQKMTQMTLAAWLAIGLTDGDAAALLMSNEWNVPGACCWQINRSGEMLLRLRSDSGVHSYWTSPLFSWQQVRSDRWRHLAATLDSAQRCVAFYVDGRKIHEERLRGPLTIAFGDARIGNAAAAEQAEQAISGFRGRIDELSVFARALSDRDIKDLYEAGKP